MLFQAPVRMRVNDEIVEVGSVDEAVNFLAAWPAGRRGPVHDCAMRGCHAGLQGMLRPEEARTALESFARITGILVRGTVTLPVAAGNPAVAPSVAGLR